MHAQHNNSSEFALFGSIISKFLIFQKNIIQHTLTNLFLCNSSCPKEILLNSPHIKLHANTFNLSLCYTWRGLTYIQGRAIAQAVNSWLPTVTHVRNLWASTACFRDTFTYFTIIICEAGKRS
jgi:hypothetical protein